MKDFINAMNHRYAVKAYDPSKKLSQQQIDELLDIANLSASSYGLQPYRIVRVTSPELRERLLEHSYGQHQVVDASDFFVLCYMDSMPERYVEQYVENISKTRNIPLSELEGVKNMMLSTVGARSQEQLAAWNKDQTYILLGTLLAGCAALGIDSTPMEGFVADEYDRILGLRELGLRAGVIMPLGYHSESDHNFTLPKVRKGVSEILVVK